MGDGGWVLPIFRKKVAEFSSQSLLAKALFGGKKSKSLTPQGFYAYSARPI
jgi:hypothetical protein